MKEEIFMLLNSNTERVINLVDFVDDLTGVNIVKTL